MIRKRKEKTFSDVPKVKFQNERKLRNNPRFFFVFLSLVGICTTVCLIILRAKIMPAEPLLLPDQKPFEFDENLVRQVSRNVPNKGEESLSPRSTHVITRLGEKICKCDLVSIDCLDSIHCIDFNNLSQSVALGVLTRKIMKTMAKIRKMRSQSMGAFPIGKVFQYTTISAWKLWVHQNEISLGFRGHKERFVNESFYPYCQKHGLVGKRCFFRDVNNSEDLDWLETNALGQYPIINDPIDSPITDLITKDLKMFQNFSNSDATSKQLPALGNLLIFGHLARMFFNRREIVRGFYKQKLESITKREDEIASTVLRVGLHIRRADACDHGKAESYELLKSNLFSPAQVSGKRLCYATSVYMKELRYVRDLAGDKRHIDVYVSTDYAGSVLAEIKSEFNDLYRGMNWHFLNYSRDAFDYENVIEDPLNKEKQRVLGETAVADLWHLSHSQVFIGHLGSRFGKLSWLLAMARHNMFVPFASIDGHSFCCEVDENCGKVKPYITSMENCMTYFHQSSSLELNKDYWENGSTIRIEDVKAKLKGGSS